MTPRWQCLLAGILNMKDSNQDVVVVVVVLKVPVVLLPSDSLSFRNRLCRYWLTCYDNILVNDKISSSVCSKTDSNDYVTFLINSKRKHPRHNK